MDTETLIVALIVMLACLFFVRRIISALRKDSSPQCSCGCEKACKNCSSNRIG